MSYEGFNAALWSPSNPNTYQMFPSDRESLTALLFLPQNFESLCHWRTEGVVLRAQNNSVIKSDFTLA